MAARFDRVFIVTYGRSGSTLLQGLLNAIPGFRIYGENAKFLLKLQDAYEALLDANRHLSNPDRDDESQPWFGSSRYDEQTVTANFRQFVNRNLFQPHIDTEHKVFGFKEIGFNELPHDRIERYLDFVRTLFPRSAIVFNTRNVADVLKSGWWKRSFWPGLPRQLEEFAQFCDAYAADNDDHSIHIRYDALIRSDRSEVARLLGFLNASLPAPDIEAVFKGSHSYENRALTGFLAGRSDYLRLTDADWWRSNIDEFDVRVVREGEGLRLSGVLAPAVHADVRLLIDAGHGRVELDRTGATPDLEAAFVSNPLAARSGFSLWQPVCETMSIYAQTEHQPHRRVGTIDVAGAVREQSRREPRR
jgi:hypothetical protein